jgi:peroxiredoxin
MTISVGDRLPEITFKIKTDDGTKEVGTSDIFAGKKVVLIGVPGAFTPTCSNNHVPGFIENYDAILARGIDAVAVLSTNDHHVMAAWASFSGGDGKLTYLADGNSEFTDAIGMLVDMSKGGLGKRTRRFSMIVDNGVVKTVNFGDAPGQAVVTGAAKIIEQLEEIGQALPVG